MYLADYHVHSTCSQDGRQTMAQAAQAAVAAGMDELCLTDHVDTIYWGPEQKPRWDFDWDAVRRQFRQAQEQWGHRITLRLGAELGEAAMSFQRAEHLMQNAPPLDFVIGSVHMAGKKFHHKDLYYIEKADEAYYDSIIDSYLEDVLALARWGEFQVLGHLTLPLRYINENYGEHMTFAHHMDQVEEIFRTIIPKGLGIECNTNRGNESLPGADILRLYRHLGGEIITLGSDAHRPADVGCFIRQRQELLRECGLELPKHTFYVDNIFVYQPLPYVKTLYYLDVNFYRYFIGREDQSVNEKVMISRIDQQIRVNKIMIDDVDLNKVSNYKCRHYMINYLEIITVVTTVMLLRSGTEENLEKKRELWRYIKNKDIGLFHRLRNGIMGQTMNLQGKGGRKISVATYRLSQKVVGFN